MKKNLTNSEDNRRDWYGEIPRKTYGTGGLIDRPDEPLGRKLNDDGTLAWAFPTTNGVIVG